MSAAAIAETKAAEAQPSSPLMSPAPLAAIPADQPLTVFVFGASGDLAYKKTYPSLFELYCKHLLPTELLVIGYGRKAMGDEGFRKHIEGALKGPAAAKASFLEVCRFRAGEYDDEEALRTAVNEAAEWEAAASHGTNKANRLFYYAIPPFLFPPVSRCVNAVAMTTRGWNRVVVEKPFGKDYDSAEELSSTMLKSFTEEQIFRIDHYLGKEMVQNLMVLRFANTVFEPLWDADSIQTVIITFKEDFGIEGRGGYFDSYGIIRDVMQNHLMQVLSLVAMEPPVSMSAEDIRDEKVKVLRAVRAPAFDEVVLGQYGPDMQNSKKGYHSEDQVPADSNSPTFATVVLWIDNPRWMGVPFVLKCGKALNERKAEVRIQFKPKRNRLFKETSVHNNELVIRIQPKEAVYLKVMGKVPGLENQIVESELDLSYQSRFPGVAPPEAYARLLLDVIRGDHSSFVRSDELRAAWRVFTPLLHAIDRGELRPVLYNYGSRGPLESDALIRKCGYAYGAAYASAWSGTLAARMTVLAQLETQFDVSVPQLRALQNVFIDEMRRGLAGQESSMKMIPSYVTSFPRGTEVGDVWAIDLGGSNLRVVKYPLLGDGKCGEQTEFHREIPADIMTSTATQLFDFIADAVIDAGVPDGANVGFTFSFPVAQTALNAGYLIEWTKGFTAAGVQGQDVVALLLASLKAKGRHIDVPALANDTVGALVSCRYQDPRAMIGMILGTGSNACYIESIPRILKLNSVADGFMVINTEWGGFGASPNGRHLLPRTDIDIALDGNSPNPGKQLYEKMISGKYLGELVRLALLRLAAAGAVWTGESGPGGASLLNQVWGFDSKYLPFICDDETADLTATAAVLRDVFHVEANVQDRETVKRVACMVVKRAARVVAMGLAALVSQMGTVAAAECTVAVDGSVYTKFPAFRRWLQESLTHLGCAVRMCESADGSGRGAALIALAAVTPSE